MIGLSRGTCEEYPAVDVRNIAGGRPLGPGVWVDDAGAGLLIYDGIGETWIELTLHRSAPRWPTPVVHVPQVRSSLRFTLPTTRGPRVSEVPRPCL